MCYMAADEEVLDAARRGRGLREAECHKVEEVWMEACRYVALCLNRGNACPFIRKAEG